MWGRVLLVTLHFPLLFLWPCFFSLANFSLSLLHEQFHAHNFSFPHRHMLTHIQNLNIVLCLSHAHLTHTYTHYLYLSNTPILTHTLAQSLSLWITHTHTHKTAQSNTLSLFLSLFVFFSKRISAQTTVWPKLIASIILPKRKNLSSHFTFYQIFFLSSRSLSRFSLLCIFLFLNESRFWKQSI